MASAGPVGGREAPVQCCPWVATADSEGLRRWCRRSDACHRASDPGRLGMSTSRNHLKTEITKVQVPVNEIELTIARWKAGEKTNNSTMRTERNKLILIYKIV